MRTFVAETPPQPRHRPRRRTVRYRDTRNRSRRDAGATPGTTLRSVSSMTTAAGVGRWLLWITRTPSARHRGIRVRGESEQSQRKSNPEFVEGPHCWEWRDSEKKDVRAHHVSGWRRCRVSLCPSGLMPPNRALCAFPARVAFYTRQRVQCCIVRRRICAAPPRRPWKIRKLSMLQAFAYFELCHVDRSCAM